MKNKTVCVIGLGYIGLPTAALLSGNGYQVKGFDLNAHVVNTINQGRVHIVEPDLDSHVSMSIATGKLKAYTQPQEADIFMICVPTPFQEGVDIPEPNISYVLTAALSIAHLIKTDNLIILESTSPVGTTERVATALYEAGVDISKIHIAYCPERVLPGKIMFELIQNDRIIGGLTPKATKLVADFYRTFVHGAVLETNAKTAEMCKLTENSFRDVNIAFANELSLICANEGINVWDLIQLANRHPRVNILQPGAGVGGHCIAVDPWFIVARDPQNARLIRTAREVNDYKTIWAINQIKEAVANTSTRTNKKPKVACLGLSFKPDIDDLRGSPAIHIAESLQNQGYDVIAVEPNIAIHDHLKLASLEEALNSADIFAILVRHSQFLDVSVKARLAKANSLDFCGMLL